MVWTRRIDAYSTHFFTRYRERKLNNTEISINETACRYFTRNEIALPIELNEDIKGIIKIWRSSSTRNEST